MLDVRDGPLGFTGNQTILYNEAAMPQNHENDQTEKQYLIKVRFPVVGKTYRNGNFSGRDGQTFTIHGKASSLSNYSAVLEFVS